MSDPGEPKSRKIVPDFPITIEAISITGEVYNRRLPAKDHSLQPGSEYDYVCEKLRMVVNLLISSKRSIKERLYLAGIQILDFLEEDFPESEREGFLSLINLLTAKPKPHPINQSPKKPFQYLLLRFGDRSFIRGEADSFTTTIDAISEDTASVYVQNIFDLYLKIEFKSQLSLNNKHN